MTVLTEDHLLAIEAGARGGALDAAVALELCAEVRRLRRVEAAAAKYLATFDAADALDPLHADFAEGVYEASGRCSDDMEAMRAALTVRP